MKIVARAFALLVGVAFALPTLADDPDTAAVVATAQLDPVLDVAVIEASAAADTNVLGLSPSVTTGIIFIVVAATTFIVMTDGN